jgi:hypothetical protein
MKPVRRSDLRERITAGISPPGHYRNNDIEVDKVKSRLFVMPLFAAFLGFTSFLRTSGAESVRAVQMVALIATGMGLGVALANLKFLISARSQK